MSSSSTSFAPDFQDKAGSSAGCHIALVLAGREIPEGLRVGGDFVNVASDLAPDAFRTAFLSKAWRQVLSFPMGLAIPYWTPM